MPRFLTFLLILSCSDIVDIETSDYLPFKKFSTWIYLDKENKEFKISAIKSDSFFIILDFEGEREYISNTGDMLMIKRVVEYSDNENLIVAFNGDVPYFPYPFVNGFNKEYAFSGDGYLIKVSIKVQREELRYAINYDYFEKTINTQKSIHRYYIFAPDSFIVYAKLGPDTTILNNVYFISKEKELVLKQLLLRND
ncbi:MAG: hypothetical protein N2504_03270 [candidate division WOR-3 bacterium]|nr:hypothetical protein [candidate division WOR-3 bacterium]MCX7947591.1 hypothetical protein [candidate division WOR-3 bacterium]MDW8150476.1 hypothetical protein [candidate division WOR-3 bacterium]